MELNQTIKSIKHISLRHAREEIYTMQQEPECTEYQDDEFYIVTTYKQSITVVKGKTNTITLLWSSGMEYI